MRTLGALAFLAMGCAGVDLGPLPPATGGSAPTVLAGEPVAGAAGRKAARAGGAGAATGGAAGQDEGTTGGEAGEAAGEEEAAGGGVADAGVGGSSGAGGKTAARGGAAGLGGPSGAGGTGAPDSGKSYDSGSGSGGSLARGGATGTGGASVQLWDARAADAAPILLEGGAYDYEPTGTGCTNYQQVNSLCVAFRDLSASLAVVAIEYCKDEAANRIKKDPRCSVNTSPGDLPCAATTTAWMCTIMPMPNHG